MKDHYTNNFYKKSSHTNNSYKNHYTNITRINIFIVINQINKHIAKNTLLGIMMMMLLDHYI